MTTVPAHKGAATGTRITMIVDKAPPDYGGAGAQALLLARQLSSRGWKPHIYARCRGKESVGSELVSFLGPSRGLGDGLASNMLFALQVFATIIRRKTDVVHIHGAYYYGFAAALACRILRRPYVLKITLLGRDDPKSVRATRKFGLPVGRLLVLQFIWANRVIALNEAIVSSCHGIVPDGRVLHLPNGVDFSALEALQEDVREPVVLFVGAISARKGVDRLLLAWKNLMDKFPAWELHLIGPVRDDVAEQLSASIDTSDGRVKWVGELAQHETWAYMGRASIFVLPSRAEGLSNALIEAMALRLRCVISDIPVNRDTCGGNAIYVDIDDLGSLEHGIGAAIESGDSRSSDVPNAVTRFSLTSLADRYEGIYNAALNR
jgi:glycosyltransferase involved in cell wall biosynthesis